MRTPEVIMPGTKAPLTATPERGMPRDVRESTLTGLIGFSMPPRHATTLSKRESAKRKGNLGRQVYVGMLTAGADVKGRGGAIMSITTANCVLHEKFLLPDGAINLSAMKNYRACRTEFCVHVRALLDELRGLNVVGVDVLQTCHNRSKDSTFEKDATVHTLPLGPHPQARAKHRAPQTWPSGFHWHSQGWRNSTSTLSGYPAALLFSFLRLPWSRASKPRFFSAK